MGSETAGPAPGAGHRPRGAEVSRIEGFSDAVFAFAVTLLVVALEVPHTFHDLMEAIWGFPAFAVCFAVLFAVWYRHHTFFRRYALQDSTTALLSGVLLFVVLFYVYPLKFVFGLFFQQLLGRPTHTAGGEAIITLAQVPTVFVFYGIGLIALEATFALLYRHAWRRRDALQLDPFERLQARASIEGALLSAAIAVLSILIAATGGRISVAWAGWVYFLNGPVRGLHGWHVGRQQRRLEERATEARE
jgi:uncharacterized membrane protein